MKKKNQLLYFEIKNTTETTVQQVPGKFITTKTDGTLHGYGIKNIMDVVEKYHGIFQSQMVEDYFVVMISVYADIYSKWYKTLFYVSGWVKWKKTSYFFR